MRNLATTLLSAQTRESRNPALSLQARNLLAGVVNLKWERLYTGTEPDGAHALTLAGDGSLIRLRTGPSIDSNKLYRQRVTNPGPGSDFSQWTYLGLYGIPAIAACSLGAEVSLFWTRSTGEINHSKSTDNGVTWTTEIPGWSPSEDVQQMAAAYKPNGDLALFFVNPPDVHVLKRVGGVWQSRVTWDKATGALSGVAVVYDGDWRLLVNGQDTDGNYQLWSLVYGDGNEVSAGTWSDLKTLASAPHDSGYEFKGVFLDKPDVYRCFFSEIFIGTEACDRPFWSHTLPATPFMEGRWREPVPFQAIGANGIALAHTGSYAWASLPSGIWRASLAEQTLDLSGDILSLKQESSTDQGKLTVELNNANGQYSQLPTPDSLPVIGCQIDFAPGYRTASGNEYSSGQSFLLEGYEYVSSPGKSRLILYALDGWECLRRWIARCQFRWNRDTSVKEILAQVLARSGIKLTARSQSSVITGFCPDFTIHPGDNGRETVKKLLSFVPDVLFLEGNTACLVNPLASDSSIYSYGSDHPILAGRYRTVAWRINRVRAEGAGVQADSFAWEEIQKNGDIPELLEDLNLDTPARAHERGEAHLREAEIASHNSVIWVPVNCGQQLYDAVDITDLRAGLDASKRRILGLTLSYQPTQGEYEQKLELGNS